MPNPGLLAGVRVIDLSQYIPGPYAARQLSDLGADVIKVEAPGGDPMRRFMQPGGSGPSPVYRHLNRGKRVCELDLKSARGAAVLAGLLRGADILIESYRPGVLARLGFASDHLDELNPRLLHCALSGYGQSGPYAKRAGHDINYCALAGQSGVSGSAERPLIGFPPIADHASAQQAAITILAALHARERSGQGCHIDLSISESILAWQYLPLLTGKRERAADILDGGAACYNLYPCADGGFVSLGAIEADFWANFCHAVEQPSWIDRQFENMPQHELIAEVSALFACRETAHWRELLDPIDCCFESLSAIDDLATQPQYTARAALRTDGPAYPAHIDQRPVDTATDFAQIGSNEEPDWRD